MKKPSVWKTACLILLILMALLAWVAFGERGLVRLHRTDMERLHLVERIRKLAEENRKLHGEVQRLRSDMTYLEAVVRKELRLIRENEVIYRFKKGNPSKEKQQPGSNRARHSDARINDSGG